MSIFPSQVFPHVINKIELHGELVPAEDVKNVW